ETDCHPQRRSTRPPEVHRTPSVSRSKENRHEEDSDRNGTRGMRRYAGPGSAESVAGLADQCAAHLVANLHVRAGPGIRPARYELYGQLSRRRHRKRNPARSESRRECALAVAPGGDRHRGLQPGTGWVRSLLAGPAARPSAEALRFDDFAPSVQLYTSDNLLIFPRQFP